MAQMGLLGAATSDEPNFDFSPTEDQNKRALWSSLAQFGASMLANNRGGFANALGHGIAAQQQGYLSALDRAQDANIQRFRTSALKDDWQAKQGERQRQTALREQLGGINWAAPDAYKQASRMYAAMGDFGGAREALSADPETVQKRYGSTITGDDGMIYQLSERGPVPTGIRATPPMQILPGVPGAAPPMTVDKRTGLARPLLGPSGEPMVAPAPKLKDIPAQALKAIGDNRATLSMIDKAIEAVAKAGDTDSLGVWNYLPDAVRQRYDPNGVALRAQVANIGGQIIHDRSGAAVTVGEMDRLKPYIPQTTDDPKTVQHKLRLLRENVASELNAVASMYPTDQGYKPLPSWRSPAIKVEAPSQAVDYLKRNYKLNPSLRKQFDQKYGEGAAAAILGE